MPARRFGWVRLVFSFALLGAALFVVLHREQLLDEYNVRSFQPSSDIVNITKRSSMNDKGTFLFYASRPELLQREPFNEACRSAATEQSAILGCYSQRRIYLFDIDNPQLDGIKEVTAVHEMLHAAYERMSASERAPIDAMLEAQDLGGDTERITKLMESYEKSEPGERLNELHSVLGSEVASLSPDLEAYYKTYLTDRSAIVALSSKYQSVFDELQSRQDTLASDLNSLADQVEQSGADYKRNLQVLNADVESFNRQAGSGTLTRGEYDSRRAALESRQEQLRSDYDDIQRLIATYEQKREELSSINSQASVLNRSINSSLTPVQDGIDG